ncbi:aspartate carbamoyltransferase [Candidatus Woesearchaeota archaeon]|nr:aspartate carbamoyltransferase [Candidatus Woesearchaeota archaeon]
MKLNHLYESQQFSPELLFSLFQNAEHMKQNPKFYSSALNEKVLATLFYEPSTRTRLSFESAMLKLGGSVISTENAKEFSSAVKGESIQDTIRIVSSYADAIVIRHYEQGAAELASQISKVPIINAGDGKGQHPTQALLDMFTIYKEINRIKDFTIIFVGDLASGRTVRSLSYLLGKFENIKIIFVSPENLKIGEDIKAYLIRHNIEFKEETDLNKVLPIADIIYMTRIQKERISKEDYEEAKGKYIINENNLHLIKQDARIMHPLPHVEEISLPLHIEQEDKRVAYFRQAENGLYIRMALLHHLLK